MLGLLLFSICAALAGAVINQDVSQVIDASTAIVRYTADVKVSELAGEYRIAFPNSWADHAALLTVVHKGKELPIDAPVSNNNFTTWVAKIESVSSANLKISAVFTGLLVPYPAEITQMENQLVQLHSSHYYFSLYPTLSQKSVFKLATSTIESFTKVPAHSVRGSAVHFGPFKDVDALEVSPLTIHFVNNHPFAKFSTMQREYEVSHWGSVSVEEIYELKHAGAILKGGFSRFDYQMRRNAPSPSFRNLIAHLPLQASNIYYRDQIGNISTSDIRKRSASSGLSTNRDGGSLELDIQTRFPIFGGWQTQFYIGYTLPTELVLFQPSHADPNAYNLKVPFFTQFQDVWVEDMEVKVVLPEGAHDIKVNVPFEMEESRTVRFTYLDTKLNGGRPVVVLKAQNLVPEHDAAQIVVSYRFERRLLYVEPFLLVGAFFVLFLLASLISRTTGIAIVRSTSKKGLPNSSSDSLAGSTVEKSE